MHVQEDRYGGWPSVIFGNSHQHTTCSTQAWLNPISESGGVLFVGNCTLWQRLLLLLLSLLLPLLLPLTVGGGLGVGGVRLCGWGSYAPCHSIIA